MDTLPPHHSPYRNWLIEHHSDPSLRHVAFRRAVAMGLIARHPACKLHFGSGTFPAFGSAVGLPESRW